MAKYDGISDEFIIQTVYGCYSDSGWCFVSSRKTIQEAIQLACAPPGQRVVNKSGEVLWDKYPLTRSEIVERVENILDEAFDPCVSKSLVELIEDLKNDIEIEEGRFTP